MSTFQTLQPDRLTREHLVLSLGRPGDPKTVYHKAAGNPQPDLSPPPLLHIPASFVLSEAACQQFTCQNRIHEVIEGLLEGVDVKDVRALQWPGDQLMKIISHAPMPEALYTEVREAYQRLGCGRVVIWPIKPSHQLLHEPNGRLQLPFLEVDCLKRLLLVIKSWWATLFSAEAIFYRELYGPNHAEASMVLAVQQVSTTGHMFGGDL